MGLEGLPVGRGPVTRCALYRRDWNPVPLAGRAGSVWLCLDCRVNGTLSPASAVGSVDPSNSLRCPTVPVWTFDEGFVSRSICIVEHMSDVALMQAETAGFDLSLVEASLKLSPEERARQHDQALALVLEFDRIRQGRDEHTQPTTPAAS